MARKPYTIPGNYVIPQRKGKFLRECLMLGAAVVVVLALLLAAFIWIMTYRYRGDRPDLYTTAVYNVYGVHGLRSNGEVAFDPHIVVLETDEYGRTLFFYDERDLWLDGGDEPEFGAAFVIMQQSDGKQSYDYPGECSLSYFGKLEHWDEWSPAEILALADPEALAELKARNDWGKPMDQSKCARRKYVKSQPDISQPEWKLEEMMCAYAASRGYTGSDDLPNVHVYYGGEDLYGRELCHINCSFGDDGADGERVYTDYSCAVILGPDGSWSLDGIAELDNPTDVETVLPALRERCRWNQPWR